MTTARYDGHADWYDETFSAYDAGEEAQLLEEFLGVGGGEVCLDVACGTGREGTAIAAAGYFPVGVDISGDQLRLAGHRLAAAVQADARVLPVRAAAFPIAVGMYVHTDVEDFAAVVSDVARCLRPGGRFIYIGLHPCFIGPFIDRTQESEDDALSLVAGYGDVGWANRGSGGGSGLWSRVGGHHKTLAVFFRAFTDADLSVRAVRELGGGGVVVPRNLAVIGDKTH